MTYAETIARKRESWEAFCLAEDYDPNDTAMWVAYSCGWQDGWYRGDLEAGRLEPSDPLGSDHLSPAILDTSNGPMSWTEAGRLLMADQSLDQNLDAEPEDEGVTELPQHDTMIFGQPEDVWLFRRNLERSWSPDEM